jgi:hypothetical protein
MVKNIDSNTWVTTSASSHSDTVMITTKERGFRALLTYESTLVNQFEETGRYGGTASDFQTVCIDSGRNLSQF